MPGEYDRTAMQRYLSVTANVEGEDLGRAARQIADALERAGTAAARRPRRNPRPDRAHARDVQLAGHRPGRRGGRSSWCC